jgi:hypothetical protein
MLYVFPVRLSRTDSVLVPNGASSGLPMMDGNQVRMLKRRERRQVLYRPSF